MCTHIWRFPSKLVGSPPRQGLGGLPTNQLVMHRTVDAATEHEPRNAFSKILVNRRR